MKRVLILMLAGFIMLSSFSAAYAETQVSVFFQDGDLYVRNNSDAQFAPEGLYVYVRSFSYGEVLTSGRLNLRVGETKLALTKEQIEKAAGNLTGVRADAVPDVWATDDYSNTAYYYFNGSLGDHSISPIAWGAVALILLTVTVFSWRKFNAAR